MILSQLIRPEQLARLSTSEVKTLYAVLFTHIIASDEIRKTLQQPVAKALYEMQRGTKA